VSIFSIAWIGMAFKYCLQVTPTVDIHSGVVVRLAITPIKSQSTSQRPAGPRSTSHLHLSLHSMAVDSEVLKQMKAVTLPFNYSQTVSDPSILHLIHLLQIETQSPQLMNQIFISSIVIALTTHLLQNFQMESRRWSIIG
jgi:hypothetical protein